MISDHHPQTRHTLYLLQLVRLLLKHYPGEKAKALKYLDFAINEFHGMKMQSSLERVLRYKEILGV